MRRLAPLSVALAACLLLAVPDMAAAQDGTGQIGRSEEQNSLRSALDAYSGLEAICEDNEGISNAEARTRPTGDARQSLFNQLDSISTNLSAAKTSLETGIDNSEFLVQDASERFNRDLARALRCMLKHACDADIKVRELRDRLNPTNTKNPPKMRPILNKLKRAKDDMIAAGALLLGGKNSKKSVAVGGETGVRVGVAIDDLRIPVTMPAGRDFLNGYSDAMDDGKPNREPERIFVNYDLGPGINLRLANTQYDPDRGEPQHDLPFTIGTRIRFQKKKAKKPKDLHFAFMSSKKNKESTFGFVTYPLELSGELDVYVHLGPLTQSKKLAADLGNGEFGCMEFSTVGSAPNADFVSACGRYDAENDGFIAFGIIPGNPVGQVVGTTFLPGVRDAQMRVFLRNNDITIQAREIGGGLDAPWTDVVTVPAPPQPYTFSLGANALEGKDQVGFDNLLITERLDQFDDM